MFVGGFLVCFRSEGRWLDRFWVWCIYLLACDCFVVFWIVVACFVVVIRVCFGKV